MKMRAALADQRSPASPKRPAVAHAHGSCPRCGGAAERIPRRRLDRLLSLVVPLRRYRCCSRACAWEGALRAPRDAVSSYGEGGRRPYL